MLKNKKVSEDNNQWKLLIARETVLLERYIRVAGYSHMFNEISQVKVRNLFIVNRDGLTFQYVDALEAKNRHQKIWEEYQKGGMKKLFPFWEDILHHLEDATQVVLSNNTETNFRKFVKYYQMSRSIVFYTNDLSHIFEVRGLMGDDVEKNGEWHERAEVESSETWDRLEPFFKKVSLESHTTINSLMFYLPEEFSKLLKHGTKVKENTLEERKRYYVLHLQDGSMNFYMGEQAHAKEKEQLPRETEKVGGTNEIRGSVAFHGHAVGRVKIVNTKIQAQEIKEGEILVSIMTTPRLIQAMKKASAIITDEGGITCHAAIVSRELKKPCIIGTKIATRVLKDGDLVEVDANEGVVRILEK